MNIDAHAYNITIRRGDFEGETLFEARVKELPDLIEYGETSTEVYDLALDAIETTAIFLKEQGRVMPEPLVAVDEYMEPWDEPEDQWDIDETVSSSVGPPPSDPARIEQWLHMGMVGYILEGWGSRAFPEAEAILERSESLIAGLKEFYDRQDPQRQSNFRCAVANLIASLEARPRYIPISQRLLQLAARLPAPEIFPALGFRIRQGFRWATEAGEEAMLTEAMLTMAQIAAPRDDALACLNELIDAPFFTSPYPHAATALRTLCQIQPKELVAHINRLRLMLETQFNHYQVGPWEKRDLAASILNSVGPEGCLRGIIKLKGQGNYMEAVLDDWLAEAIFSKLDGQSPLLECRGIGDAEKKNLFIFNRPGQPENPIRFKVINDTTGWLQLTALFNELGCVTYKEEPDDSPFAKRSHQSEI